MLKQPIEGRENIERTLRQLAAFIGRAQAVAHYVAMSYYDCMSEGISHEEKEICLEWIARLSRKTRKTTRVYPTFTYPKRLRMPWDMTFQESNTMHWYTLQDTYLDFIGRKEIPCPAN